MKVDLKKQLETRSFRVKGIDVHPSEPLIVASLYTGTLQLWNFETQQLVRSVEISSFPARAVKFIARKNWIVVGSDDMQVRVYSISTLERVAQFEAHLDYIRAIAVHPTLPLILTAGDDMVVKSWDWDRQWATAQTFRGHQSYILSLAINPKDPNQFASGSMDRTVKVWTLDSNDANYTLPAHDERGVNYVEYYPFADKPYLLTTSDDQSVRIFDYQSKQVVATLQGHTHNVSFAVWHPELPLIVSGSEDASVRLWNSRSYKLEQTLNFGLERAWCIATRPNSNLVVVGYETGLLALRIGRDEPVVSMDSQGKIVWAKQLEAFSSTIKAKPEGITAAVTSATDEVSAIPVHLQVKDLGALEMQPNVVSHSPDGRVVAVCGDNDVVVYTALAWRSKFFTSGIDFCWGPYDKSAVLRNDGVVQVQTQLKKSYEFPTNGSAQRVFGGEFIGVVSDDSSNVSFYDWESGDSVATISVDGIRQVLWSDEDGLVAIITEEVTHVLRANLDEISQALEDGKSELEDSFEEVAELSREPLRSAMWIGSCLVYTTASNRLNYLVGTETYTISHFDRDMYVLEYLPRDSAIYLCDKDVKVVAQPLSVSVVELQTAVLRGEVDEAVRDLLPKVPERELTSVARFFEAQKLTELALETTRDSAHKFELALALDRLELAASIAGPEERTKWRQLGDRHLAAWDVDAATVAYERAHELDTLLLIHTSTGSRAGLEGLAAQAERDGRYNLAFSALWSLGATPQIAALLNKSGRHAEAALFGLTYGDDIRASVEQWKDSLAAQGRTSIAERILMPESATKPEPETIAEPVQADLQETKEVQPEPEQTAPESETVEPETVEAVEPVETETVEPAAASEVTEPAQTNEPEPVEPEESEDVAAIDAKEAQEGQE